MNKPHITVGSRWANKQHGYMVTVTKVGGELVEYQDIDRNVSTVDRAFFVATFRRES